MPEYGRDFRTMPRFDWSMVDGFANLWEAAYWRLRTPRGSLEYAPDYGLDVTTFVQRPWNAATKYELETLVAAELEKDERFDRVFVETEQFDLERLRLSIRVVLEDEEEFVLVLGVDRMTVEVLRAE
jgi:phage baseplate assembly protein W